MSFASFARWARPRNCALSQWNRNLAMNMQMTRGMAATPLLRLAADPRPLEGFVEQRGAVPLGAARQMVGESLDELSEAAAEQAVAAVLANVSACTHIVELLNKVELGFHCPGCSIGLVSHQQQRGRTM